MVVIKEQHVDLNGYVKNKGYSQQDRHPNRFRVGAAHEMPQAVHTL